MSLQVYFAAGERLWPHYEDPLRQAFATAGLRVHLSPAAPRPAEVDYLIVAPDGPVRDFRPFSRARAVLSLWAGVEALAGNPTLTQPLCRMVDPTLTEGMREWVVAQVLRHHLGLDAQLCRRVPQWAPRVPPLARERSVCLLGLGVLGRAAARSLRALGFQLTGWSRRPKRLPGVRCLHGPDALPQALAAAEILVTLLPLTAQTENLLDARRLAWLPPGATLINPGRGALIDDDALLAALDSGRVGHATLDAFRIEPLPPDHPYWHHPRVTVSPHVAAVTRPKPVSQAIADNIRRDQDGRGLAHRVVRRQGY